ncbi:MAG: GntR family transcriptional regulator [Parvibaculaceae bacterium]
MKRKTALLRKSGPSVPGRRAQKRDGAGGPRSTTIAQRIRVLLEEDIIVGKLRPGERIDEVKVGEQYDVSRTPVREALNNLASTGLVEVRPRQGTFVAEFTLPKLVEMFEVMAALEGFCVRLAARRVTDAEIQAIRDCHREASRLAEANDSMGFYEKNNELHSLFYEASGNATLIEMTVALRRKIAPYRRYATYQKDRIRESVKEHQAVIDAIMARDDDAADRLMRQHLSLLALGFSDLVAALAKRRETEV